ncbi:MAG: DUF3667 domain-containing protein [Chryseobacterium sp.]|jgi:hypothetical protein|uniref:DUF3667 domain-containing protein n=1 Tax=Chryseobacterium sp. TaxID=1871047 RepID=UPI00281B21A4|nr:DUF3667 domain-containing protein [Chryseobacterium sp.]MDR2237157.1 DUF3667 domain-containing protein [Chryseobacterium sp.]
MSHGKIREDKNCLNCGHHVEERYCPHCGQQNIESRQPFHYLFTHFIEDFTHYDGQFWGTVKNLLFKPGKLTTTYLEGKRQEFVPPVKLYIFVSFVTFFMFAIFPPFNYGEDKDKHNKENKTTQTTAPQTKAVQEVIKAIEAEKLQQKDSTKIAKLTEGQKYIEDSLKLDSFQKGLESTMDTDNKIADESGFLGYKTQQEYDKGMAGKKRFLGFVNDAFAHKFFSLKEQGVKKGDIMRNLVETSFHNLPKALFIYLPVFALFLWIFHNKKKWWYFDHGIFTLHYFSFLLVNILVFAILNRITNILDNTFLTTLIRILMTVIVFYGWIYFFIAHHRVYKSHGIVSVIIGGIIFFLNMFAFLFLVTGLALVSFLMLH